MKSRWYELKDNAIRLRRRGLSIGKVERSLGIPRSTLSGWFKDVELSPRLKQKLHEDWVSGLVRARKKATLWHNAQKNARIEESRHAAERVLAKIDHSDPVILELALALLYLGEGSKTRVETAIGSSDPLILKFFLSVLRIVYHVETKKLTCQLGLRADQNEEKIKKFWANELGLPVKNFKYVYFDKRTAGSKTYPHYRGVCKVYCGDVAIQRKLMHLSRLFCQKIICGRS